MKIYTRGGDDGETALFGGRRVAKHHVRIHAYGEIDELNSIFGWCIAVAEDRLSTALERECSRLFTLGSHLATPPDDQAAQGHLPDWPKDAATQLEAEIDAWDANLAPLKNFVLPGGSELAARLHLARTVCRRAERGMVALLEVEGATAYDPRLRSYINRLSDWLFTMAREANRMAKVEDQPWVPERSS